MWYHLKVITAGRAVNDYMPLHVFELLVDALNGCERSVKGSKVVVLGGGMLHHLRRQVSEVEGAKNSAQFTGMGL